MDIDDIMDMGDVCEKFCEGCAAIRRSLSGLEEPNDFRVQGLRLEHEQQKLLKV